MRIIDEKTQFVVIEEWEAPPTAPDGSPIDSGMIDGTIPLQPKPKLFANYDEDSFLSPLLFDTFGEALEFAKANERDEYSIESVLVRTIGPDGMPLHKDSWKPNEWVSLDTE